MRPMAGSERVIHEDLAVLRERFCKVLIIVLFCLVKPEILKKYYLLILRRSLINAVVKLQKRDSKKLTEPVSYPVHAELLDKLSFRPSEMAHEDNLLCALVQEIFYCRQALLYLPVIKDPAFVIKRDIEVASY